MIGQALAVRQTVRSLYAVTLALAALAALPANPAAAQQAVADFYKGKQIKFIIRSEAGGGYDLASRLIASHIIRHIPGNPSVLPQNMPGAGGITSANYVAEIAPKDGTSPAVPASFRRTCRAPAASSPPTTWARSHPRTARI